MTEVLHANIFFFITAFAVIFCTILLSVVLYQVIKILTALRRIVDRIEAGSEKIAEDMEEMRTFVRDANPIAKLFRFIMPTRDTMKQTRTQRKRVRVVDEDED